MDDTSCSWRIDTLKEACDYERLEGWDLHAVQTTPGVVDGWRREWRLDGVQLLDELMQHVTVNIFGLAPADSLMFGVLLEGESAVKVNGRSWGVNEIAIGVGRGHVELLTPPARLVTLVVRRDLLADYLWVRDVMRLDDWVRGFMMLVRNPAIVATTRRRIACLTAADFSSSIGAGLSPAQAMSLRDDILDIAADIVVAGMKGSRAPLRRSVQVEIVHQARRHVVRQRGHALRVIDLCRATRVSRRSLQTSFMEVVGVTPVEYLRLMRLDAARRMLFETAPTGRIQDVLAELGIWHASHFSAEYRALFGELPSETLRRR